MAVSVVRGHVVPGESYPGAWIGQRRAMDHRRIGLLCHLLKGE